MHRPLPITALLCIAALSCRAPAPSKTPSDTRAPKGDSTPDLAKERAPKGSTTSSELDRWRAGCEHYQAPAERRRVSSDEALEHFERAERVLQHHYLPLVPMKPPSSQEDFETIARALIPEITWLRAAYRKLARTAAPSLLFVARLRWLQLNRDIRSLGIYADKNGRQPFVIPRDLELLVYFVDGDDEASDLFQEAATHCIDTAWTRITARSVPAVMGSLVASRKRATRWPRLGTCPRQDRYGVYADGDPDLLATLEERYRSTLKGYRTPTTPSILEDVVDADQAIFNIAKALIPQLRGMTERYAGPAAIEASLLLAKVHLAWAQATEDVPAPQSLFRGTQSLAEGSPLSRWQQGRERIADSRRAEARRVLEEAAKAVETFCLGEGQAARVKAAMDALPAGE